jgi:hypothetical protein
MSLEQNLAALQRHHDHFRDRVAVTRTVLDARGPGDPGRSATTRGTPHADPGQPPERRY